MDIDFKDIITTKCPQCNNTTFVTKFGEITCNVLGCTHVFLPDQTEIKDKLIKMLVDSNKSLRKELLRLHTCGVSETKPYRFPDGTIQFIPVFNFKKYN